MNILKRAILSCAFVCALAVSGFAQSADDNTITGNVYDAFNNPLVGFSFTVTVTRRDGVAVSSAPKTVTTITAGALPSTFQLPRRSFVTFRGGFTIGRYNFTNGVSLFVPDESTTSIYNLKSVEDAAAALVEVAAAPSDAQYIVGTANGTLSAEQSLGALTTGLLKNTVSGSTGTLSTAVAADLPLISTLTADATPDSAADYVLTYDASAGVHKKVLLSNLPSSGGGGTWGSITGTLSSQTDLQSALDLKANLISPSFTTPTLGVASATSINKLAITTPATGSTLAIADGKTFTASNTITLTATDGSTLAIGAGGTLGSAAYTASSAYEVPLTFSTGLTRSTNTITVNTSQNIATLSNLTSNGIVTTSGGGGTLGVTVPGTGVLTALGVNVGSAGAFVVNGGALGTPSSGTLTNATGLPISTGVSGLGTGVATFLATPSSANLASALTDETGSGAAVFGTSPTIAGGTHTALTALGLRSTGTGAFDLTIANSENLTAGRTLTLALGDAARTLTVGASASVSGTNTGDQTSVSGNAGTATALQTARTIGGVSFDGTANITVASATGGFAVTTELTTPSTTFALANATATTINAFGAATTINVGTSATVLNFGGGATAGEFRFLEPSGSGTNYSAFKAVAQGANITYSLPPTVGAAGTVLTDAAGDGVLTWAAGGGGGTPGGSTTQLQYNNAGAFGGISTLTSDGTIVTFSPTVTTGTGATSGLDATANSLTTGDAFTFSSSSVTTGNLVKLASTSTAAGSNTQTVLNVATSGANGTSTQTTYGARVSNTHTGTSSTNIAADFSASGGTTNIGLQVSAGLAYFPLTTGSGATATIGIGATSTGFGSDGAGVTFLRSGSIINYQYSNGFQLTSDKRLEWASGIARNTASDIFIRRSAAANLAFGAADAASPVAQTLSVQNVVAGTSNTAGANWTFTGSRGTGTGAGGSIIFQTAPAGSTGSSQNALVTAVTIGPNGAFFPKPFTFSALPTISDGGMVYCSDCAPTSAFVDQTCAGSGTGAMAYRLNGAWKCYN